jgi:hypothetical protein
LSPIESGNFIFNRRPSISRSLRRLCKMKHRTGTIAAVAFCVCVFFSVIPVAKSQQQGPGAEKAQEVAQVLNLSPTQRSQLTPILEQEAPKVKAITDDPNLSPKEKKEKLKAVHSQTDPLVKSILNPSQYTNYTAE